MRSFGNWPLRAKMLVLIALVSALPLGVTALVEFRESSQNIEKSAEVLLQTNADSIAGSIDEFHASMKRISAGLARLPLVMRFCDAPGAPGLRSALQEEVDNYAEGDPRLHGLAIVDTAGTVLLDSGPHAVGVNLSFRPYLREAVRGENSAPDVNISLPVVGSVPLVPYASPVRVNGKVIGVVVAYARAAAMWGILKPANGRAGEGSFAVLLDQHGVVLANSQDPDALFHPAARLSPAEIEAMAESRRFGDNTRALLEQPIPIEGVFERARGEALAPVFRAFAEQNHVTNLVVSRKLSSAPWTFFYLVPVSALHFPVEQLILHTALANTAVVLLALLIGVWLADRILKPVRSLNLAAERLQHGDLTVRVQEKGTDELGALATAFNAMAGSLAASQEQLEQKILRRTEALATAKEDLEKQNASLAQRTAELTERQDRDLAFTRTLAALSGPGHLREVMAGALRESEEYLRSLVLVCYRTDRELLAPVAARGGEPQTMRIAGRVQEAFAARKPVLVEALPEDAELRFDAGLAAGKPQCIVLVPLTMGDRDVGLLAAGFGSKPSAAPVSFLVELALPLALAIGRHELHEQTERFALQLAQRNEVLREQSEQLAMKQGELEQKNKEIARANDLKSEFLANMSHELRTPLNAVIGFSELLLEEKEKLLPAHVQFVRDIVASGRHLLTLINSVLDLAKIEAGRVTLEVQPLDPRAQIISACTLVSALAQRKNISVAQVVNTRRTVLADRAKVQQILLNLLSNAIKFSEPGKDVEVGVEDQEALLRFWVKDQGPGISEAVRPELFKPFVQGEAPLSKKHEGTGLGLAITRRLVEYQGGDVGVETELGHGSTFWFTLPADERTEEPVERAPAPLEPAPRNGVVQHGKKPLVLVVEDDPANARLLRFHLEGAGYAVVEAKREGEAIDLARRLNPQVVLLDLILPDGEDGMAVLRDLKSNPQTVQVPVIVVSVVQETRRARELGAAECFVKPVDAPRLLEAVQKVCPAPVPSRSRATVLVVDDHDLNRELARTLLERRGCRVLLARNGQEGTRVAKVEHPDLVLMDLAMPVKDGITAARELKADPETSRIPLIAFTALAMRGDEERARKAGFDGYLTKPLETQALDATLEKFLIPTARA